MAVEADQFEPLHAALVAAAMRHRKPDRALLARAAAGREAVSFGADPALTLALVVWPSEELVATLEGAGVVKGSGLGVTASPI